MPKSPVDPVDIEIPDSEKLNFVFCSGGDKEVMPPDSGNRRYCVVDDSLCAQEIANPAEYVEALGYALLRIAEQHKLVVTIENVPLMPPAMGHYEGVVTVRPKRGTV